MPYSSGIWRPHRWEDWEIELVDASLDTVGLVDEAVQHSITWGIYGYGDGSLSLSIQADIADDLLAAGQWYFRFFRGGVQIRDFMLAKDDRGYKAATQYIDEYIMITLAPLDLIFKDKFGYPSGGGPTAILTTPALPIDDAMKWLVDKICGPNAYAGPGASVRIIPGLTIAADLSAHPTVQALDQASKADLYDVLQKYGINFDVDWRVRLERTAGIANQMVFETFYPRRGLDKTIGNGARQPIVINDASGEIVGARRYRPAIGFANVIFNKSLTAEYTDAASVALYGRHEIVADTDDADACDTLLGSRSQRIGIEIDFVESEMMGVGTVEDTQFEPGDEVTLSNHHLAFPSEDTTVQAIKFTMSSGGQENIAVTTGRYEKDLGDSIAENGGGTADNGTPKPPVWIGLKANGTVVPFTNTNPSYVEFLSGDGSVTYTPSVGANTLDLSAPGSLLWTKVAGAPDHLVPTDITNDVKVGALITLDASTGDVIAPQLYQGANDRLSLVAGGDAELRATSTIYFAVGGTRRVVITTTQLRPSAAGLNLGSIGVPFGNTFINAGAYINHADGDATHNILGSLGGAPTQFAPRTLAELGIAATTALLWADSGTALYPITDGRNVEIRSGLAATITLVAATSQVRADYLYKAANTNVYFPSSNIMQLGGNTQVHVFIAGAEAYRFAATVFQPAAAGKNLGAAAAANRWSTIYGIDLELTGGDVTISTAGKGLIYTDNTLGKILMGDGTRYVPHTFGWADLPDHKHVYYQVINWSAAGTQFDSGATQPTLSGITDTWVAGAHETGYLPVYRDTSTTQVELIDMTGKTLSVQTITDDGGAARNVLCTNSAAIPWVGTCEVGRSPHTHALSGGSATAAVSSHTHKIKVDTTIKTGSPVAP